MHDLTKTVRHIVEGGFNKGDMAIADAVCHPAARMDICIIDTAPGPDGLKRYIENSRRAFPDLNLQIEFMLQSGPLVFSSWVTFGTHKGSFLVPATGQVQRLRLFGIWLFEDGKLKDLRGNWETTTMMRAFNILPADQVPSPATDVPQLHQLLARFPTRSVAAPADPGQARALIAVLRSLFCGDDKAAFLEAAPAPDLFWTCIRDFRATNAPGADRRAVAYDHIRETLANRRLYVERLVTAGDAVACRWMLACDVIGGVFGSRSGPRSTLIRGTCFATLNADGGLRSWYDVVDVVRQYRDSGTLADIDYYRHQPPETGVPSDVAALMQVG
jgi:predicted ester cyclase